MDQPDSSGEIIENTETPPAKRGRGRPKKISSTGRGRPPKSRVPIDESEQENKASGSVKRGRGRPKSLKPKKAAEISGLFPKRGRGRPRKNAQSVQMNESVSNIIDTNVAKNMEIIAFPPVQKRRCVVLSSSSEDSEEDRENVEKSAKRRRVVVEEDSGSNSGEIDDCDPQNMNPNFIEEVPTQNIVALQTEEIGISTSNPPQNQEDDDNFVVVMAAPVVPPRPRIKQEPPEYHEQEPIVQQSTDITMADYTAGWSMRQFFGSLKDAFAESNEMLIKNMTKEKLIDGNSHHENDLSPDSRDYYQDRRRNSNGPTTRKCVTELKNAIVRIKCPALEGTRHRMDDLLSNIGDEKVSLERLRLAFDAALAIISS